MKAGKVVALVIGCLIALIGAALLIGTGALTWAHATQRDDDGYFTSHRVRIETVTAAVRSQTIDLGSDKRPDQWPWADRDLATVRLQATAREGEQIFIGIAHTSDLDTYLTGIAHDEVTEISWSDGDEVKYRRADGAATAPPPTAQTFWAASAEGEGRQTLTWDVEGGNWSILVMNPDGSANVAADVSVGVKVHALVGLMIGLGVGSVVLLGAAAALIVFATRRPAAAAVVIAPVEPLSVASRSPVRLAATLDEPLSRGLWLVKWFLAIPHFFILVFLWVALVVMTFVAGVAILFTRRYPKSIFDFNVGVLRWTWRVTYYATSGIGTDRYPPFTLGAVDYPATLDVEYPGQLNRWLVLVKWWLLAIPHYIVVGFFIGGGWFFGDDNGRAAAGFGLIGWVTIFAGVALLFTARYPRGLFDFVMGMNRWAYRVIAYASLMTDRYPPFTFDAGANEPGPLPPPHPLNTDEVMGPM